MADSYYFSKDTKMFVSPGVMGNQGTQIYEIPILDGFSISQSENTTQIEVSEAGAATRRGTRTITDSFSPVEFSFSTYVRPYKTGNAHATDARGNLNSGTSGFGGVASEEHGTEEILWALMFGATQGDADGIFKAATGSAVSSALTTSLHTMSTAQSNVPQLKTGVTFTFQVDENESAANTSTFSKWTISDCVVNEATIDFDIEGIATIQWSCMGRVLVTTEDSATIAPTIFEGKNIGKFIQNKLSYMTVDGQVQGNDYNNIVLTGGSVTLSNNITFVTPEQVGLINRPVAHHTGALTLSGSFTCYLDSSDGSSMELIQHLQLFGVGGSNTSFDNMDTKNFNVTVNIGGSGGAQLVLNLNDIHLELPQTNFEDVISAEINFHGGSTGQNINAPTNFALSYNSGES